MKVVRWEMSLGEKERRNEVNKRQNESDSDE